MVDNSINPFSHITWAETFLTFIAGKIQERPTEDELLALIGINLPWDKAMFNKVVDLIFILPEYGTVTLTYQSVYSNNHLDDTLRFLRGHQGKE